MTVTLNLDHNVRYMPGGWGINFVYKKSESKRIMEKINKSKISEVYKSADLYDIAYPGYTNDVSFYEKISVEGKVLYLGVGTGRDFSSLASKNPQMIGIEKSKEMLNLFIEKFPLLKDRVHLADVIKADFPENSFDTIIAPYSFLQFIERCKLDKVLQNVKKWLVPKGHFYTDVFSPFLIQFRSLGIEKAEIKNGKYEIKYYLIYNHITQEGDEYAFIKDASRKEEKVTRMHYNYYFPCEILNCIQNASFAKFSISGGYNNEPYIPAESEIIVINAVK